jgi:hypothetical protein
MKQISFKTFALFSALTLSACGPQAFAPSTIISDQTAAGGFNLAPKVDIVLGVSQSGGMNNIQTQVGPAIQQFIANLKQQGWDYRFVGISLREEFVGSPQSLNNNVAASRYHTNYSESEWLKPYPGATYLDLSGNPNPLFLLNPNYFNPNVIIPNLSTSNNDGRQPGLKIQADFLNRSDVRNEFLRPDALLAVITITNERDTSAGWTSSWNGYNPNPVVASVFTNQMKAVKAVPLMAKYYAIVAEQTNNCVGSIARVGTAYIDAALSTNGEHYNLCSSSSAISNSLYGISQHLQKQTLNFHKEYLVISTQPDQGTLKVYKNGSLLSQNSTNGWTYVGYQTSQNTVYLETNSNDPSQRFYMSPTSGYMIKLNGSAILSGKDTARVEYMNQGAQYSN